MTRVTLTLCCMFCFHLLFAAGTLAQEMRLWVDITGKHKLIGEFVGENDGIVTLKMKDKTEVEIPLDKLSDNDQKHVAKLKEGDGDSNPFQKKGESNPFMKKESSTSSSTEPAVDLAGTGKVLEDDYTKARDLSVGGVIPTTWDIELQPGSFA